MYASSLYACVIGHSFTKLPHVKFCSCIEQHEVTLDIQLYDLVASTPLGVFIKSEDFINHLEERLNLYQLYLSDFVNSVYKTTRESEFKVMYTLVYTYMLHIYIM